MLSRAFASEIHELGGAHPQHRLLEQAEGTVTAIGADRTACMVLFGQHTHKLLIGRGGAFQLKLSDLDNAKAAGPHAHAQAVDPRAGMLGIEWHQVRDGRVAVMALTPGMAASKCGKIETGDILMQVDNSSAAATVAQVEARLQSVLCTKPSVVLQLRRPGLFGDSVFSVSITLDEWLMDGSSVDKGLGAGLSKEYCACIAAAGDGHQHHKIYMLNATGVVTAIGLDKQACIVDFPGAGSFKMLIGRQGADGRRCYTLAHRPPLPGSEDAVLRVASSVAPPSLPSAQLIHQSGVEDRVVVGKSLRKGTLVCLSKSYQDHLHGLNTAHAHSVLLGAKGVVTAIGEDKEACIVDWGTLGTHKMLVGRNGSFQLSEPSAAPPAVPAPQPDQCRLSDAITYAPLGDAKADGGGDAGGSGISDREDGRKTWQEDLAMKLISNLLSPSGAAREADIPRRQQSEKLVIGKELVKGAQVKFSEDYAAIISMAGASHPHHYLLGSFGVVTAIGLDQEACHVCFGEVNAKPQKFLVGRRGQHQLAYVNTHDAGTQNAAIAEFEQEFVRPLSPVVSSALEVQEHDPAELGHVPTGLGIMVAQREGNVVIESLAKGSAAAAVGPYLRVGDRIISCDGKSVTTIADFEKLARGKVGSSKRLQVSRVRGRVDAAAQGGKGGLGHGNTGGDKQLVFMMSLVIGVPNAHTLFGQIRDAQTFAKDAHDDSAPPDHAIISSRSQMADDPCTDSSTHTSACSPETNRTTKFRSLPLPPQPSASDMLDLVTHPTANKSHSVWTPA